MSKYNPYHRFQALGAYMVSCKQAQRSIEYALRNSRTLSDNDRAHLNDALGVLESALAFDKTNEAECKAMGVERAQ